MAGSVADKNLSNRLSTAPTLTELPTESDVLEPTPLYAPDDEFTKKSSR